eukprot:5215159-Amphidinium_carterae.1
MTFVREILVMLDESAFEDVDADVRGLLTGLQASLPSSLISEHVFNQCRRACKAAENGKLDSPAVYHVAAK